MIEHQLYIFTFTFSNIPELSLSSMAGKQNPPSVSNTPEALGPTQQIDNSNNLTGRPSFIHPSLHQPCVCMYVYPQQRHQMKHKGDVQTVSIVSENSLAYGIHNSTVDENGTRDLPNLEIGKDTDRERRQAKTDRQTDE